MEQFANSIDRFLEFREYQVLPDYGKVAMKVAQQKASEEYDIFNKTQKITSDFDKEVRKMLKK